MLDKDTQDYYLGWRKNLEAMTDDNLQNLFMKFTSLFFIYSRLYEKVPEQLKVSGELDDERNEKKRATEFVIKYLGAEVFLDNLTVHNNDDDISVLEIILQNGFYNIVFKNEIHDPAADQQLHSEISGSDKQIKATAILKMIYQVRNNIVHSRKHFEEDQRLLLTAALRILETVVEKLYTSLNM